MSNKAKKDSTTNEILPEVFMVSDQGTAMQRDGVFADEQNLKTKMAIRQSDKETIVPNVLEGGTPQKEVDTAYFLTGVIYWLILDCLRSAKIEQVFYIEELRLSCDEQKDCYWQR